MKFDSLRFRLVLSHILPLLVMIPLMGIALVYVIETRVLLPQLASKAGRRRSPAEGDHPGGV